MEGEDGFLAGGKSEGGDVDVDFDVVGGPEGFALSGGFGLEVCD